MNDISIKKKTVIVKGIKGFILLVALMLAIAVLFSVLYEFITVPIGKKVVTDPEKRGHYNIFVSKEMSEHFFHSMPYESMTEFELEEYNYSYFCGFFGMPNFSIRQRGKYSSDEALAEEYMRLYRMKALNPYFIENDGVLFLQGTYDDIEALFDGEIRDGMAYRFEIVCISEEGREAEYFSAVLYDGSVLPDDAKTFLLELTDNQ